MKRRIGLALLACAATLACDARDDRAHAGHHAHRDLAGGEVSGDSLYQLAGDWQVAGLEPAPLASLRGSPVLLLFFYGTCDYACPKLVHDLQRIDGLLGPATRERVRYALVSFDPERDTPERLAAYARDQRLAPERWRLLHGSDEQVRELAATVGVRYRPTGTGQFSHTMRIVLLDREGVPVDHWDGLTRPLEPIVEAVRAQAGVTPDPDSASRSSRSGGSTPEGH